MIVTELIPGSNLNEEINKRSQHFTEEEVANIMHQLISAVHHIHSIGIAHRDIKPENIMINELGKVTLIDFGLSKAYSKERVLKTKAGSPLFMAPEVHWKKEYSSKCDIWGLGILLYILLSSNVPFSIDRYEQVCKEREFVEIPFSSEIWSHTSAVAIKLLKRMLIVHPSERI